MSSRLRPWLPSMPVVHARAFKWRGRCSALDFDCPWRGVTVVLLVRLLLLLLRRLLLTLLLLGALLLFLLLLFLLLLSLPLPVP